MLPSLLQPRKDVLNSGSPKLKKMVAVRQCETQLRVVKAGWRDAGLVGVVVGSGPCRLPRVPYELAHCVTPRHFGLYFFHSTMMSKSVEMIFLRSAMVVEPFYSR